MNQKGRGIGMQTIIRQIKGRKVLRILMVAFLLSLNMNYILPIKAATTETGTVTVSTVAELKSALANAMPGDEIIVKPGTYVGTFTSSVDGTSSNPITITSESSSNKAILKGNGTSSGTVLNIKGDHWKIRHLKVTNAQKGIILDNANHCHIYNCEVYDVGMEGIHLRDNSSNNIVDMCTINRYRKG